MNRIWILFWVIVIELLLFAAVVFIPGLRSSTGGELLNSIIFIMFPFIFFFAGILLDVFTILKKIPGLLKVFLVLTGTSAAGIPVFFVLHNLASSLTNSEEPVFFVLTVLVAPLALLAGIVGTTGWSWPQFYNDLGVDYNFRYVVESGTKHYAEIWRQSDNAGLDLAYSIDNDTLTLTFDSIPGDPTTFNFVVLARQYGNYGNDTYPQLYDKMPAVGHFTYY